MALDTSQQFLQTIERSKRPVILLSQYANIDDFVSAYTIEKLLARLQKPVDIVTSGGKSPDAISFLKQQCPVRGDLSNISKLTLCIDTTTAKVDELSYDKVDGELRIHLTPKTGTWKPEQVRIDADQYKYDLIIAIGAHDFEQFGTLYKKYADFFFQTPIINIDHATHNEHFGQLNIVDINATACSEVCHDMLKRVDETLIDEEVATLLLTGMIFKTKSFRGDQVTPKTLKVASALIAKGARRDEIVQNLYKTRSVETLRLWGRALARLKSDKEHTFVWTMLTKQDFANAGAGEEALENVIEELIVTSPNARIAAVFYESGDGIHVKLHAEKPYDALSLGAPFNASGTREEVQLQLREKDIVKAEKRVVTHIREQLKGLV